MEKIKALYEQITPKTPPSELAERIISGGQPKTLRAKKQSKPFMYAAVSAAVMMCSATVAAAGGRNIFDIISSWLKIAPEETASYISKVSACENLNTFDDLTVSPRGVYSDDTVTVVFIDLTRTDGKIFNCAPYEIYFTDGTPYLNNSDGKQFTDTPRIQTDSAALCRVIPDASLEYYAYNHINFREYIMPDDDPSDSTVTMALFINRGNEPEIENEASFKFSFRGLSISKYSMRRQTEHSLFIESRDEEHINGKWEGVIDFKPTKQESLTVSPDKISTVTAYPQNPDSSGKMPDIPVRFVIDEIKISKLSAGIKIHSEAPEQTLFVQSIGIGDIIMDDGRVIPLCSDHKTPISCTEGGNIAGFKNEDNTWYFSAAIMLPEPVDTENISAVRIGSEIIRVKK